MEQNFLLMVEENYYLKSSNGKQNKSFSVITNNFNTHDHYFIDFQYIVLSVC
jgi:hypothetical protein